MKLFVEMNVDDTEVINISTVRQGATVFEVELVDPILDFDKLKGYKVELVKDYVYHMKFDQAKYDAFIGEAKKAQSIKDAEEMRKALATDHILSAATDEEAYVMRYLYNEWKAAMPYEIGDRAQYLGNLYKCKQKHTSQAQHTPELIPAIWDLINPVATNGTYESPINIPEPFSSMVYEKGKYYKEGGQVYLMNRAGMTDGEEISLAYKPSQLVGQYFKVATSPSTTVPETSTTPDFKQPTGAHDAYKKGDQVMYKGVKYESLIDNNVYAPDAYAQGWKEVV